MRIWDIPPKLLCRNHLLGEHRELHAIWSILTQETMRMQDITRIDYKKKVKGAIKTPVMVCIILFLLQHARSRSS